MLEVHELLLRLAERQAAITQAQLALHRLIELGLVAGDAVGAPERDVTHSGPGVAAAVTHASDASPGTGNAARQDARGGPGHGDSAEAAIASPGAPHQRQERACDRCGKVYRPDPRVGERARYCSARCRQKAAAQRRRDGEDAGWRAKTAELRELHEAEGYNGSKGA